MSAGRLLVRAGRASWPLPPLVLLVVVCSEIAYTTGGPETKSVVVVALINLTLVVGLYTFVGNSGVFSFGHIGFAAIGAYTAGLLVIPPDQKAILQPSLPTFIGQAHFGTVGATLMGGVVAAVVAAVLAVPLMRLDGLAAGLATFAVLVIVKTVANSWDQVTNGAAGLSGLPISTDMNQALVWVLIAMVAALLFQNTGLGLRLRGSREDYHAARSIGVSVHGERRVAWVFSAFLVGIGGGLYGQYLGSFNANAFYLGLTFTTLAMLVVGGLTSLSGAVIGSLVISFVAEFLNRVEQGVHVGPVHIPARLGLREVGLAVIMLVILILRPRGLTNGRELPWPTWRRRGDAKQEPVQTTSAESSPGETPVQAP